MSLAEPGPYYTTGCCCCDNRPGPVWPILHNRVLLLWQQALPSLAHTTQQGAVVMTTGLAEPGPYYTTECCCYDNRPCPVWPILHNRKAVSMTMGLAQPGSYYTTGKLLLWWFRQHLTDLLFLGSFSDQFQRVRRIKNKNKSKNRQSIAWKCKYFRKAVYFLKIILFCRFLSYFLLMVNVQENLITNNSIEPHGNSPTVLTPARSTI